MHTDALPLAEALDSLRGELLYAVDRAADRDLRFAVEAIELELQVVRTAGGEASGSAGLWQVLTVGGKATYSSAATHRVKLVLAPRPAGSHADVEGDFLVGESGSELPG
jgi:Trypsin-co-occurring domain 2